MHTLVTVVKRERARIVRIKAVPVEGVYRTLVLSRSASPDISDLTTLDRSHPTSTRARLGQHSSPYVSRLKNPAGGPNCGARHDATDILTDTSPAFRPHLRVQPPVTHARQPVGTGSAQIRWSIAPNSRRVRWALRQQEPVVAGVIHLASAGLDEALLHTGERPAV